MGVAELAREYWHLVAHRTELAEPGDFVRLTWPLGELVAYNDQGRHVVFDNICPHRGGRFFVEDCGSAPAVCPYHGWAYRDGEVRVARAKLFAGCDLSAARLNTFSTQWCGDFLFAGVEPRTGLLDQLGDLAFELAAMSHDIAGRSDLNAFAWESDWRVAVENALESYHIASVHPGTLGMLKFTDEVDRFVGPNSAYAARIGDERTLKGLRVLKRFFDVQQGFEEYRSLYLFPFTMVSSTFGFSYSVQHFFPSREANRTHFVSRLLAARPAAGAGPATEQFLQSTARVNRQVFDEDHAMCRRVSPFFDLQRPDRMFAASEQRVRHFCEALRQLEPAARASLTSADAA